MSNKNKTKGRKPTIYPLPTRTVLYSRKKYMTPIPEVGKKYHCFDDGKITFSRHFIIQVDEVLGYKIREALKEVGIQSDRGTQAGYTSDEQNNFQIIEYTDMTACIVELGFISNDEDNRLFDKHYKEYEKLLKEAKELGVNEFFIRAYGQGYQKGYDNAVKRLIKRT